MPRAKLSTEWSIHFIDSYEIAEDEYEPPTFKLVIYDINEVGYDVRDFMEYPTLEEVQAALASFRKAH